MCHVFILQVIVMCVCLFLHDFFSLSPSGVLWSRKEAVGWRRSEGLLWEVQWVPAHRLRTIVSQNLKMFLSFAKDRSRKEVKKKRFALEHMLCCMYSGMCSYKIPWGEVSRFNFHSLSNYCHAAPSVVSRSRWKLCSVCWCRCHTWIWSRCIYSGCGKASSRCTVYLLTSACLTIHHGDMQSLRRPVLVLSNCRVQWIHIDNVFDCKAAEVFMISPLRGGKINLWS